MLVVPVPKIKHTFPLATCPKCKRDFEPNLNPEYTPPGLCNDCANERWRKRYAPLHPSDGRGERGPQICGFCGGMFESIDALMSHEGLCSFDPTKHMSLNEMMGPK